MELVRVLHGFHGTDVVIDVLIQLSLQHLLLAGVSVQIHAELFYLVMHGRLLGHESLELCADLIEALGEVVVLLVGSVTFARVIVNEAVDAFFEFLVKLPHECLDSDLELFVFGLAEFELLREKLLGLRRVLEPPADVHELLRQRCRLAADQLPLQPREVHLLPVDGPELVIPQRVLVVNFLDGQRRHHIWRLDACLLLGLERCRARVASLLLPHGEGHLRARGGKMMLVLVAHAGLARLGRRLTFPPP
mmetsp:Transcript_82951/g.231394  ORF Transcript_82951/g.231394 Transcript_82951/m.231394 type:complete len:249 (-) Transcript_82951:216-962(-)